jgi:hypothetical protein
MDIHGDVGPAVYTVSSVCVRSAWNDIGFLVAAAFLILNRVSGGEPWKRAVDSPFLGDGKCHSLVVKLVDGDWHVKVRGRAVRSDLTSTHYANVGRCRTWEHARRRTWNIAW